MKRRVVVVNTLWPLEKFTYVFVGIPYKKCAVERIWSNAAII